MTASAFHDAYTSMRASQATVADLQARVAALPNTSGSMMVDYMSLLPPVNWGGRRTAAVPDPDFPIPAPPPLLPGTGQGVLWGRQTGLAVDDRVARDIRRGAGLRRLPLTPRQRDEALALDMTAAEAEDHLHAGLPQQSIDLLLALRARH